MVCFSIFFCLLLFSVQQEAGPANYGALTTLPSRLLARLNQLEVACWEGRSERLPFLTVEAPLAESSSPLWFLFPESPSFQGFSYYQCCQILPSGQPAFCPCPSSPWDGGPFLLQLISSSVRILCLAFQQSQHFQNQVPILNSLN